MAKSKGNFLTLQSVIDKNINPLAFRYLVLSTNYRSKLNFSWESLEAAANGLNNLYEELSSFEAPSGAAENFEQAFKEAVSDDLNMPKALAIVWELLKNDEVPSSTKLASLFKFDEVLGLKLKENWTASRVIPPKVTELMNAREQARQEKDFKKSDDLRHQILTAGFILEDTVDGVKLKKKF